MTNLQHPISSLRGISLSTRSTKRWALGLALSALTVATIVHAKVESIGDSGSYFLAVGPAGLKIEGKGEGIVVSESGGEIKVKVPVKGMKTGISMRDKHLWDALKVQKYPNAILKIKRSALTFPANDKTAQGSATGSFTIHGTTAPSTFKYKVKRTGSDYHVQGNVTIDITKYKMEIPCYLGVCVDKKVKVKVKFKVREH